VVNLVLPLLLLPLEDFLDQLLLLLAVPHLLFANRVLFFLLLLLLSVLKLDVYVGKADSLGVFQLLSPLLEVLLDLGLQLLVRLALKYLGLLLTILVLLDYLHLDVVHLLLERLPLLESALKLSAGLLLDLFVEGLGLRGLQVLPLPL